MKVLADSLLEAHERLEHASSKEVSSRLGFVANLAEVFVEEIRYAGAAAKTFLTHQEVRVDIIGSAEHAEAA